MLMVTSILSRAPAVLNQSVNKTRESLTTQKGTPPAGVAVPLSATAIEPERLGRGVVGPMGLSGVYLASVAVRSNVMDGVPL